MNPDTFVEIGMISEEISAIEDRLKFFMARLDHMLENPPVLRNERINCLNGIHEQLRRLSLLKERVLQLQLR